MSLLCRYYVLTIEVAPLWEFTKILAWVNLPWSEVSPIPGFASKLNYGGSLILTASHATIRPPAHTTVT